MGASSTLLEAPGRVWESILEAKMACWRGLGVSWGLGGASWGSLGAVLGPYWGHIGAILGPSWAILGHPGAILGPSSAILGLLGAKMRSERQNIDFPKGF